jgi:ADP-heptose:LPS heptosyltransferase
MVIGISWKSFNSLNKAKKSVQLKDMETIFSGLDVVLVNLQYGDVEDEIREFKVATGIDVVQCASVDNREDLEGLAALIEVCDLVISITNVTVHLAGALAKKTWVLLPYVPNFWWLLDRPDSVWYPNLSLYRQPTLNDWDSVYVSIRKDLETRLR